MEGITRYQNIAEDELSIAAKTKRCLHKKDRLPSCSSSSSCETLNIENPDDAYHEDGLDYITITDTAKCWHQHTTGPHRRNGMCHNYAAPPK